MSRLWSVVVLVCLAALAVACGTSAEGKTVESPSSGIKITENRSVSSPAASVSAEVTQFCERAPYVANNYEAYCSVVNGKPFFLVAVMAPDPNTARSVKKSFEISVKGSTRSSSICDLRIDYVYPSVYLNQMSEDDYRLGGC